MKIKAGKKFRDYLIKVLNGMAQGLFASLIIGLILKQLGTLLKIDILVKFGVVAQHLMGPAIGTGVAYSVGASPLGIFSSIICGAVGAGTIDISGTGEVLVNIGEPVGAFVAALAGAEFSRFIQGKTKVDIVLVPAGTIITGGIVGVLLGPVMVNIMSWIGNLINVTTELHPIPMGILVSTLMGMVLTLPISSAALAISLGLEGLAAGAATIGCSAQMIGFAVASYRENKIGGLIAQGIGTSMLQIPNIIKNPLIWLPPTITSAILGPVGTVIFKMENNPIGAGMGTSGLVGQFATIEVMGTTAVFPMILLHFLLPAILTLLISEYMRKREYIKYGDMLLSE
ncbi:MAG: PTS sugar transporter subunit IIC [Halanaerobiaceae bacterium]|nr:PTS sugar transporter subunit IIC [Halanaerobiaceae bacterium]